jgi:hypothetical protein
MSAQRPTSLFAFLFHRCKADPFACAQDRLFSIFSTPCAWTLAGTAGKHTKTMGVTNFGITLKMVFKADIEAR